MGYLRNAAFGAAGALLFSFAAVGSANATLSIIEGDTPGSLTNVLFDEAQSGTVITGYTQPSKGGTGVQFISGETLTTTGIGQADITGTFNDISATPLLSTDAFNIFQFDVKLDANGDVTITAYDQFNNAFSETFTGVNANAGHRYTITASLDEVITRVDVTTSTWMTNYRQVRIEPTTVAPAPVPEPLSLALLSTGLLGLGLAKRRKE